MSHSLLTLIATPALEDSLIDWLLEHHDAGTFTSARIDTHGGQHGLLSIAEQVSGRQRKVMFQVKLPSTACDSVLAQLHQDYHGAGLEYWITPISHTGYL